MSIVSSIAKTAKQAITAPWRHPGKTVLGLGTLGAAAGTAYMLGNQDERSEAKLDKEAMRQVEQLDTMTAQVGAHNQIAATTLATQTPQPPYMAAGMGAQVNDIAHQGAIAQTQSQQIGV